MLCCVRSRAACASYVDHAHFGMPWHLATAGMHDDSVHEWHFALFGLKPHGSAQWSTAQSCSSSQHAAQRLLNDRPRLSTHDDVHAPPVAPHSSKHAATSSCKCSQLSLAQRVSAAESVASAPRPRAPPHGRVRQVAAGARLCC